MRREGEPAERTLGISHVWTWARGFYVQLDDGTALSRVGGDWIECVPNCYDTFRAYPGFTEYGGA